MIAGFSPFPFEIGRGLTRKQGVKLILIPVFDFETSFGENLSIICTFSVASIFRGYLWRRLFNWLHNKFGRNFILKFFKKIIPGKRN